MFLTRSEYGMLTLTVHHLDMIGLIIFVDRGVNTFSPEGRLFQGALGNSWQPETAF